MAISLRLKSSLIGTPLQGPTESIVHGLKLLACIRHPGLWNVRREEAWIARIMKRCIGRSDVCVDVGAHIGSMLSGMRRLAPDGRHHAFEALPSKAGWLRDRFPDVHVHEVALSDETGTCEFYENLSRSGFSGLGSKGGGSDRVITHRVRVSRLDDEIPADVRVGFLKLDVEGAELRVLRGGRATIERSRPIILFESGPGAARRLGHTPAELFDELTAEFGYRIFLPNVLLDGGPPLTLDAFEASHVYPFGAFNYLAVPPERAG